MPRGRLILPFLAEIARLDTSATAAASGYDSDFRTIKHTGQGTSRVSSTLYLPAIQLRCQVEDGRYEEQRQTAAGNAPDSDMTLVFHFVELERRGLVDTASGDALLRVDDKLLSIRDVRDGSLIQAIKNPPGLFCVEAKPTAFGLSRKRNLFIMRFAERAQGLTT